MGLTEWFSLGTMVVLAVTAAAIFWYSWETRELRKEKVKEIELSMRPQIIAYLDRNGQNFFITNVARGTAMNVMVDDLLLNEIEKK